MTGAALLIGIAPAFAETETVVTKQTSLDGGTTTTTTRYYYNDSDANNNGILDSNEFGTYVYNRWDRNGDGFITDDEWQVSTTRWYPAGTTVYKTYPDWDANNDGHIDSTEFGTVVTTTKLYETWDVDSDNTIEGEEYAKSSFRVLDENDDGSLTLKEYQAGQ